MATKNFAFIDSRVAGYETLIAGLSADTAWYLLDANQDGVDQMQRILAGYSELNSVQVISHGSTGTLYLGSTVLNGDNLASYQTQLQAIGSSLTETGDILLYGCNVAQGDVGVSFVNSLAQITGADVAVSNNLTGSEAPGQDTVLEVATGGVEATALDLSGVAGPLAVIAGTDSDDNLTGTASNDTISGGDGNDSINGGDSIDVAVYSGTMSGYLIEVVNGQLTLRDGYAPNGDDGTDRLANIEVIRFADGELTVPTPSGPVPEFAEFAVNVITKGNQWWPVAKALDDGGFTITWQSRWLDDTFDPVEYPYGTYSRTYDAQGIAVGGDTRIGDYLSDPIIPGVSSVSTNLTGGGQVVLREMPDGMYNGIFARLFDSQGHAIGAELQVNQTIRFNQTAPVVLATPDGGFLTAWHAYGQDGSGYGIFMRRYDASGAPLSDEIQVNDFNYATQSNPSLAVLSNGDYLIAWQSGQSPEIGGYDIQARRFTANLAPVSMEIVGTDGAEKMYGGAGTTVLRGGGGNDILKGGADHDVLYGDSGADTLNGESGNDNMFGGAGNDIFYVDSAGDKVFETLTDADLSDTGGVDTILSPIPFDLDGYNGVRHVENLTLTSSTHLNGSGNSLANVVVGNAGNNILSGRGGNDSLSGMDGFDKLNGDDGNDVLDGGTGADSLSGGAGDDTYYVENIGDRVFETVTNVSTDTADAGGVDLVYSSVSINLNGYNGVRFIENLTLTGLTSINGTGNALANVIVGNTGANVLDGGLGADSLAGGLGNDIYVVDNVNDVVAEDAGAGVDTVNSYLTSYTLGANIENGRISRSGTVSVTGNALDNLLYAGVGSNVINGDAGVDTTSYINAGAGVTVSLGVAGGQATGGSATDTLIGIENLVGSNYVDVLSGDSGNNVLDGGEGADFLSGGEGNDTYIVNSASDVVTEASGQGTDTVRSTAGTFTLPANVENGRIDAAGVADLVGNALNNVIYAGAGNNALSGGDGTDTLSYYYGFSGVNGVSVSLANLVTQATGGSGFDILSGFENLTGSNNNDRLTGSSGNNVLNGYAGTDTLVGGTGDDTYYVDVAGDVITETSTGGKDLVLSSFLGTYVMGNYVEEGRINTTGAANLTGNGLSNILYAGAGNNVLNGGTGAELDTVSYQYGLVSGATSGVTVSLLLTGAQTTGRSGSDTLIIIENLTGSSLNDTLIGSAGNNVLDGGSGTDSLVGGLGNDTYVINTSTDIIVENANEGTDTVNAFFSGYILGANIEYGSIGTTGTANITGNSLSNILFAGAGNNVISGGAGTETDAVSYADASSAVNVSLAITTGQATGGSGTDTLTNIENLTGSNFNDTLTGSAGNNVLDGGTGDDNMAGGAGNDTYYVRQANDIVTEAASAGTDTVYSYLTHTTGQIYTLGANIENGRVVTTIASNMTGNVLSNTIYAGVGNNSLVGGDGTDTLNYVYGITGTTGVTVTLGSTAAQSTGGSGSDTISGFEDLYGSNNNDSLTGNTGANYLYGYAGNDTLLGGDGADTLVGAAGQDSLSGGAGNDLFDFNALSEMGTTLTDWDVIADFVRGQDKIDLVSLDANAASTATNEAFSFIGSAAFSADATGQLRYEYNSTNGYGVLYGSTDADTAAEFAIQITGVSTLADPDFWL